MPVPTVVIVSGPSGAGKTHLARQLAARLALPWYSRDTIKEALFDTLGWSDRSRPKDLGAASVAVLFSLLSDALGAGTSCLTESNFRRTLSSPDFQRLLSTTGAGAVQIQCGTDGETLLNRFTARFLSTERHPGHCDDRNAGRSMRDHRRRVEHTAPHGRGVVLVGAGAVREGDRLQMTSRVERQREQAAGCGGLSVRVDGPVDQPVRHHSVPDCFVREPGGAQLGRRGLRATERVQLVRRDERPPAGPLVLRTLLGGGDGRSGCAHDDRSAQQQAAAEGCHVRPAHSVTGRTE